MEELKGNIFSIIRSSVHDGEGIRTVIYFKGCPLKCAWCHNPEGISFDNDILYYESKCVKCGSCVMICPNNYSFKADKIINDRKNCVKCGRCVDACPNEALILCGKLYTCSELINIVKKDKLYYDKSNGGVTLSGGEFLSQINFAEKFLRECKNNGINTAVETSLYADFNKILGIIDLVDTFIVDIKHMSDEIHLLYTGVSNKRILENIKKLSKLHNNIWIRVPMIPDVNDSDENIIETVSFLNGLDNIKKIELLKYNNLAENKYIILDKEPMVFSEKIQSDEFIILKNELIKKHLRNNIEVINQYQ